MAVQLQRCLYSKSLSDLEQAAKMAEAISLHYAAELDCFDNLLDAYVQFLCAICCSANAIVINMRRALGGFFVLRRRLQLTVNHCRLSVAARDFLH
jgi:hypothetical protein